MKKFPSCAECILQLTCTITLHNTNLHQIHTYIESYPTILPRHKLCYIPKKHGKDTLNVIL